MSTENLAYLRAMSMSADLQVQLEAGTAKGTRPMLAMLGAARIRARDAIVALCDTPPADTEVIRTLQSEVKLYAMLIELAKKIIDNGAEAEAIIREDDRIDIIAELSATPEGQRELQKLGITQEEHDA